MKNIAEWDGKFKDFIINFAGLKEGWHEFEFKLDSAFFSLFPDSPISNANIKMELKLERKTKLLDLLFSFSGTIDAECDRCLEIFGLSVTGNEKLFLKLEEAPLHENVDPDIIYIGAEASQINLAEPFYEFVILNLPMRKVHPDDEEGYSTCDSAILELLEQHETEDVDDLEDEGNIDPRWSALKNLKQNPNDN